ncbi:hypothetical protein AGLY_003903 [Aphis glycines]|uniref:Uncharacterized protein n=1 Tax=Aphis glycines TaxID=307491 RepID=A0A6G0TWY3_APHGL|nr:hypothetical protein AGLY_003903 [Aphis glycines]
METVQLKFSIWYTRSSYLIARFLAFIKQLKKLLRNLSYHYTMTFRLSTCISKVAISADNGSDNDEVKHQMSNILSEFARIIMRVKKVGNRQPNTSVLNNIRVVIVVINKAQLVNSILFLAVLGRKVFYVNANSHLLNKKAFLKKLTYMMDMNCSKKHWRACVLADEKSIWISQKAKRKLDGIILDPYIISYMNSNISKSTIFSDSFSHSNINENKIADKVAKDGISNPLATSVSSTRNKTRRTYIDHERLTKLDTNKRKSNMYPKSTILMWYVRSTRHFYRLCLYGNNFGFEYGKSLLTFNNEKFPEFLRHFKDRRTR